MAFIAKQNNIERWRLLKIDARERFSTVSTKIRLLNTLEWECKVDSKIQFW